MSFRSRISLVLDEHGIPSDEREYYYRFILMITDVDSKELEREIEGFAMKGCDEHVLRRLMLDVRT